MAFVEDFDQFLDLNDFAEPFEWNGNVFNGIFDNETYQVEGEASVPVHIQQPTVLIKASDSYGMNQGDKIVRVEPNVEYRMQTFAPDGTGMMVVGLSAVSGLDARRDTEQRTGQQRQRQRQGQT